MKESTTTWAAWFAASAQMQGLLTEAEAEKLALMSLAARPQTDEQMKTIYEWACGAVVEELMLRCVLSGNVAPFVREDGEICFKEMRDIEQPRKEHAQ